jgi:hypothetical protein
MAKNRNYNYKDVDMLMASKSISESFKKHLPELSVTRTNWTVEYANGLIAKIDVAIDTQLGIDPKKDLREASDIVYSLQVPAKRDLSFFKTQVNDDFKNDKTKRDEILKVLGFTKSLKDVGKGNHQALILLLYTFKTNMTDALKQEITAKGMNVTLINNIVGYADSFKTANVTQENFKETTKIITKELADSFNVIYNEIIGLCKIVSSYYRNEPLKKEQFNFSKVIDNIGATRKAVNTNGTALKTENKTALEPPK